MDKVIFAVIAEVDDENDASWPMKSKIMPIIMLLTFID